MAYKLKTLVVFDTNSLRSTEAGKIAYSFFAFGKAYQVVEQFIDDNQLAEDVHIAIPEWAIEELKDQKQRQFQEDVKAYGELAKRLAGLPHMSALTLPNDGFDCTEYLNQKAQEYLVGKNIQLLTIAEAIANDVLRSMMVRVMKAENDKAPFAHSGKYKDAGFKDNLVWESLMHYPNVAAYDKVIFLTKDGDFKANCKQEFETKWERFMAIEQDENNVLSQLKRDYENYINNRKVYDYAQKEYFGDYLSDLLGNTSLVQVEGEDSNILNYTVRERCQQVDAEKNEDGDYDQPVIISNIVVYTNLNGRRREVSVTARTILSDIGTLDIEETTFEPALS